MSRRNEHDSDNEDDPEEPYDSSGDEWNVEVRDWSPLFIIY